MIKELQEKIWDTLAEIDRLEDLQNRDFYDMSQCARRAMGRSRDVQKSEVYNTHSISVRIMRRQEKIDAYSLGVKQATNQINRNREYANINKTLAEKPHSDQEVYEHIERMRSQR